MGMDLNVKIMFTNFYLFYNSVTQGKSFPAKGLGFFRLDQEFSLRAAGCSGGGIAKDTHGEEG